MDIFKRLHRYLFPITETSKPAEVVKVSTNMQPLTREQKEYIKLEQVTQKMFDKYLSLRNDGLVSDCRTETHEVRGCVFVWESMFYQHLEDLKAQHKNNTK